MLIGDFSQVFQGVDSGVAYVYVFDGTNWNLTQTLGPSSGVQGDHFGSSVAILGNTIAVGARNRGASGAVFIFEKSGGSWVEVASLTPASVPSNNHFGHQVALGDEVLVSGTEFADFAYEFRRVRGTWVEGTTFAGSLGATRLGRAIGISGNRVLMTAHSELAFEFPLGALHLSVTPSAPNVGDLVTFDTFCGPPNSPVILFLMGVNGIPVVMPLLRFQFASDFHFTFSSPANTTSAGLDIDFMSIGLLYGGEIVASNMASVSFQ